MFSNCFKYGGDMALKVDNLQESWLWHKIFGHLNFYGLKLLSQNNMVVGLPRCIADKEGVCEDCALGKHHRKSLWKELYREQRNHLN